MPILSVFPDVIRAYNRVEINWSDTPSAEWARVLRVDVETGICTPLRPYVCFYGDYLNISCDGHGIFWDTEVPLDRSVYYITQALDGDLGEICIDQLDVVLDMFGRLVVNGWGTPDIGPAWVTAGGAAGDYNVSGNRGHHVLNTANVARRTTVPVSVLNPDIQAAIFAGPTATVASYDLGLTGRRDNGANTEYAGEVVFNTTGFYNLRISRTVAGVRTVLATGAVGPSVPVLGERIDVRLVIMGSTITFTADDDTNHLSLTVVDTVITAAGGVGTRSFREAANTNAALDAQYDDFILSGACLPCEPVEATSPPSVMPSNGAFRLKDPVRPCNDLYVPLCFSQVQDPSCLPGSGIFFAQMDVESYDANTMVVNPTNAALPIAVNRTRRGKGSLLQLVTRTFADRNALLNINSPGSPLLLQGPPNYGIDQAYISVGTLSIERGLSDHRFPVRINNLPFLTVTRPAGPSQGVCGSRVQDTCDIYDSWAELTAQGFSYEDLVRGRASDDGNPPIGALRTWGDVDAEFVDWAAVDNGRTWTDLLVGD